MEPLKKADAPGGQPAYPGTPVWVKVFGLVAGGLGLSALALMLLLGGGHGPSRHLPAPQAGQDQPSTRDGS